MKTQPGPALYGLWARAGLAHFLSVFLFRDFLHYAFAWLVRSEGAGGGDGGGGLAGGGEARGEPTGGLNPTIIASFPTLPYSAVKGVQEGKCGPECAVCLVDFSRGDVIRLLTAYCHAFHPACIDSWLASHPHNLPRLSFQSRGAARRGCGPGGEGGRRRRQRGRPCDRRSGRGWGGAVGSDAEIVLQERKRTGRGSRVGCGNRAPGASRASWIEWSGGRENDRNAIPYIKQDRLQIETRIRETAINRFNP